MGHECHGAVFAVGEDFVGYLVDEEIEACRGLLSVGTFRSIMAARSYL